MNGEQSPLEITRDRVYRENQVTYMSDKVSRAATMTGYRAVLIQQSSSVSTRYRIPIPMNMPSHSIVSYPPVPGGVVSSDPCC
jgi:hypothetical protein